MLPQLAKNSQEHASAPCLLGLKVWATTPGSIITLLNFFSAYLFKHHQDAEKLPSAVCVLLYGYLHWGSFIAYLLENTLLMMSWVEL